MTTQEFAAKVKAKYPQYATLDDHTLTQKMVAKYPQYQAQISDAPTTKPGMFPVAPDAPKRPNMPAMQADQAKLTKESTYANSPLGLAANTARGVVDTLTSSEQNLGRTIGNTLYTNKNASGISDVTMAKKESEYKLLKAIQSAKRAGHDTTHLEAAYNRSIGSPSAVSSLPALPSKVEAAGQVAGVALDVLTPGTFGKAATGLKTGALAPKVLPGAASIATKPAGLLTKQGAGRVLGGAGIGYGYDVSQGLQGSRGEDRTGANALIPGAGTALGAALPAATGAVQSVKGLFGEGRAARIVDTRKAVLQKVVDSNAPLRKVIGKTKSQGIDAVNILANTDLLHGAVDNTGTIRTTEAIHNLNDFIKPQEDVISANLKKEGKMVRVKDVEKSLKTAVENAGFEGSQLTKALNDVKAEIEGYNLRANDGYISLSTVHDAKVDKYGAINYLDPKSHRIDKVIAKTLKGIVQDETKSVDVKKLNDELAQHYAVQSFLEKLDGKKVEGGRLGKHFARILGGIVGAHFGPLGSIAGAELAGGIKGASLASKLSGKTGQKLEQSTAMKTAVKQGEQTVVDLPAKTPRASYPFPQSSSNKSPALNASQPNTMTATNAAPNIPSSIAQPEGYLAQGVREAKQIFNKSKDNRGFIRLPGPQSGKPPVSDEMRDAVAKELSLFDANAPKVNGKLDLSGADSLVRLGELQDLSDRRALTAPEVREATMLLKDQGIDVAKADTLGKGTGVAQSIPVKSHKRSNAPKVTASTRIIPPRIKS